MSKKSEFVMQTRKENFDRVSVLLEKGGNELLRVLALREGTSIAEYCRRAILARAGLHVMPYQQETSDLAAINTKEAAKIAVRRMQLHEESDEILRHVVEETAAEPNSAEYIVDMDRSDVAELHEAIRRIDTAISAAGEPQTIYDLPVQINLTGREVGILRRFLSNIEQVDQEE